MKKWLWLPLLSLYLLCQSLSAQAVIETYQFDNEVLRARYNQFINELRCPKCQNQNLAGSNSPISEDLRRELHRLLEEGRSDQQIVDYMVERYGDFILYRPRFNPETALLWMAPGIFLLLGCGVLVMVFKRQKQSVLTDAENQLLNNEEQQKLQRLLAESDAAKGSDKDQRNA
jgi:cytochrome c-type biogenesis protein CcmH